MTISIAQRFALVAVSLSVFSVHASALAADGDIRLSSIGYLPLRAKRASVVMPATTFSVVRDSDGRRRAERHAHRSRERRRHGGERAHRRLSSLSDAGTYHLEVDGVGRSVSFPIDADVYRGAFVTSMLGFYGWRCGTDVAFDYGGTHYGYPACHLQDADTTQLGGTGVRDGLGGWHDAGDYGKYTVNAALTLGTLLAAWQEFQPPARALALQIPETGGALPDYHDEVRWELGWLLKMSVRTDRRPRLAQDHEASHPAFIMPQADTGLRSFVSYGTGATADFVAVLAEASRVYRRTTRPFADQCLAEARVSYDYLQANPANVAANETNFIGVQYTSSDDDDRLWAAAELWETTGDAAVLTDFETRAKALTSQVSADFDWANLTNLGVFTYLSSSRAGRDDTLVGTLQRLLWGGGRFAGQ